MDWLAAQVLIVLLPFERLSPTEQNSNPTASALFAPIVVLAEVLLPTLVPSSQVTVHSQVSPLAMSEVGIVLVA